MSMKKTKCEDISLLVWFTSSEFVALIASKSGCTLFYMLIAVLTKINPVGMKVVIESDFLFLVEGRFQLNEGLPMEDLF